jgi:hypothetical protein
MPSAPTRTGIAALTAAGSPDADGSQEPKEAAATAKQVQASK